MFPKLNTLKEKRYDDMETIEHIAVEQLLMIQETGVGEVLPSSAEAEYLYILKEPTLKEISLPSL
jgi:hypothetical protein